MRQIEPFLGGGTPVFWLAWSRVCDRSTGVSLVIHSSCDDVAFAALVDVGRRRVDQDHGLAVGVMAGDDASDWFLFHFTPRVDVCGGILRGGCGIVNAGMRGAACDSMTSRRYSRPRLQVVYSSAVSR